MHIRTQTHSGLTNAQSWKRKQCVLFCLLSAEGLVSHTNVFCFRLKVSGESVQHQWPLSQAAFNRLYCWFWVSLWEGQRFDNRESWFSRAPWQIGDHTRVVQWCLDVLFVSDCKGVRRICLFCENRAVHAVSPWLHKISMKFPNRSLLISH